MHDDRNLRPQPAPYGRRPEAVGHDTAFRQSNRHADTGHVHRHAWWHFGVGRICEICGLGETQSHVAPPPRHSTGTRASAT
jgi:hypothetical protein